jgi:RimJ/RimL family protein N-acetyltransferase
MDRISLQLYNLTNETDTSEIEAILKEYYPNSPWPVTKEKIKKGGVVYYRAYYQGEQIGITGYAQKTPTLAETVKTTIFNPFRGRKLGGLLSQAIEDECKSLGIKKVMSTVYYFNHQMVKIKLKQGYTIEGYHPDHEAPGFHEYSLGKVL